MDRDFNWGLSPLEFQVSLEPRWILEMGLDVLPYDVPFLLGDILLNVEVAKLLDPCLWAASEYL